MTVAEDTAEEETAKEAGTADVMATESATVAATVTVTVEVTVGHARTKIYFNDLILASWRYVCRTARQPHHGVAQYRRLFPSCPVSDLNLT